MFCLFIPFHTRPKIANKDNAGPRMYKQTELSFNLAPFYLVKFRKYLYKTIDSNSMGYPQWDTEGYLERMVNEKKGEKQGRKEIVYPGRP